MRTGLLLGPLVLATTVAACLTVPVTGTKGTMPPPGPNGELDPSAVPDFIAVAGPVGVVGYVRKAAVFDPGDSVWPVYGEDLRTVVGHMIPGRGFVALGMDPNAVPTFAVVAGPVGTPAGQAAGVVRAYVRNQASIEASIAVVTSGRIEPGGGTFDGGGYIGIACLSVPEGSRLVLLDRSPGDPQASIIKALYVGEVPVEPVSVWLDVLPDGAPQTGSGQPDWWVGDVPC